MNSTTFNELSKHFRTQPAGLPGQRLTDAINAASIDATEAADEIDALARHEGIDETTARGAIAEAMANTKRARLKQAERERKERAARHIEQSAAFYTQAREAIEGGADPACYADEIQKQATEAGSITTARGALQPASFDEYHNLRATWNPDLDFRPRLIPELPFPRGTVSYIGARTARGKSAILVNLARESMARSRRAVYVTLELSPAQLFDRLITSTAYAMDLDPHRARLEKPTTELYGLIKNGQGHRIGSGLEDLHNAYMDVKEKRAAGLLTILDARGAKLAEIMDAIRERSGAGDLVLLDYIQRLPSVDGAAKEGYERMKAVSDTVINTATRSNCILIAAAQFNRAGAAAGEDDTFTDASFRESGDLEQDAHNAIGLGWKADKKSRFIEILKAREAPGTGDLFDIDWRAEYFYMGPGERIHRKETDTAKKTKPRDPAQDVKDLLRGGKR